MYVYVSIVRASMVTGAQEMACHTVSAVYMHSVMNACPLSLFSCRPQPMECCHLFLGYQSNFTSCQVDKINHRRKHEILCLKYNKQGNKKLSIRFNRGPLQNFVDFSRVTVSIGSLNHASQTCHVPAKHVFSGGQL